jgi:4-amino-4-deoxy-L-arabinose transferase-like glycosyltransferase
MSVALADEELQAVKLQSSLRVRLKSRTGDLAAGAALMLISVLIGCFHVYSTGTLWPDGPQYTNAAAMIHDWLASGKLAHPYLFAQANYAQYPAFHMPFHPPAYPGLLGLFFFLTGVSYVSARVFVAICLGVAGYFFYSILKRFEISRRAAFACSLVLVTTPEIARWSRDTMSEVPALALIMAGSYFFLRWLKTNRTLDCCVAFVLAEAAFLSRVTTAGILPAWFLLIVFTGNFRRLRSRVLILMTSLYLVLNAAWTVMVSKFAKYEMGAADGAHAAGGRGLLTRAWEAVSYYWTQLPHTAGWGLLIVATGALFYAFWLRKRTTLLMFTLAWLLSSAGFLLTLSLVPEPRYFFYVLPGMVLALAILFSPGSHRFIRAYVAPALVAACLVVNAIALMHLPRGLVGYDALAGHLAHSEKQGNILALSWFSQDFIFRYRAERPAIQRMVERGDRTLAIRLSDYGGFSGGLTVPPVILAHNKEDVLSVMRRGRVRYLLTCAPDASERENRTEEMILAHGVAEASPDSFALVGKFPLTIDFENENFHGQVFLWEFKEELPDGPSELPVVVPTADMVIGGN